MTMREVGSGEHRRQVSLYVADNNQIENSTAICPVGRGQVEGEAGSL
jgi:hypothetical protein